MKLAPGVQDSGGLAEITILSSAARFRIITRIVAVVTRSEDYIHPEIFHIVPTVGLRLGGVLQMVV